MEALKKLSGEQWRRVFDERTHSTEWPFGSGGILDDPMFANADFTRADYPVAQIRVSVVPIPGAVWLMLTGLAGLLGFARKRG